MMAFCLPKFAESQKKALKFGKKMKKEQKSITGFEPAINWLLEWRPSLLGHPNLLTFKMNFYSNINDFIFLMFELVTAS